MQKYIFFFESQIFVPIFVPLPSALLISESRKQSVVKSVFLCLFTVLCMAVLSNSVDMSKKSVKIVTFLCLLCFMLIIRMPLQMALLSKWHGFAFRLLVTRLRVKSGPLFIRKRATFYAETARFSPLFRSL